MKAERFQAIVEAYGADPARWPEAERDAALGYAGQTGEAARAVLAEARALDAGLAVHAAPLPDAAAFARALKGAGAALTPAGPRPRRRTPPAPQRLRRRSR